MGQAKNRGTAEERLKEALQRQNEQVVNVMKKGMAPHYAFIFDRSETGRSAFLQMKNGPAELKSRANSSAVQLWENATNFEYVVIWGTWGYTGGLTLPTANIDFLLNEALPAAMKRTLEKGGLCAFIPAVDESVRDAVMSKIAELQPITNQTVN